MDFCGMLQAWLAEDYNIKISNQWLEACVEWIHNENSGKRVSLEELKALVFEQWLLSDLTEIGEPVLPPGVVEAKKVDLRGMYPLQLLSVVDIGFPLYSQAKKLKGQTNPNEEVSADKPFQPAWEAKPSSTLLLQLTDGHTTVQAMEWQRIECLHGQLTRGVKLLVQGSLTCRHGVILLSSGSVQLLGGEVDTVEGNWSLDNLHQAMRSNKEKTGTSRKKEFSGRFLSHGYDKKVESTQQAFAQRRENCKATTQHADDEWDDDLDYGAVFDDIPLLELDQNGSPSHQEIKAEPQTQPTSHATFPQPRSNDTKPILDREAWPKASSSHLDKGTAWHKRDLSCSHNDIKLLKEEDEDMEDMLLMVQCEELEQKPELKAAMQSTPGNKGKKEPERNCQLGRGSGMHQQFPFLNPQNRSSSPQSSSPFQSDDKCSPQVSVQYSEPKKREFSTGLWPSPAKKAQKSRASDLENLAKPGGTVRMGSLVGQGGISPQKNRTDHSAIVALPQGQMSVHCASASSSQGQGSLPDDKPDKKTLFSCSSQAGRLPSSRVSYLQPRLYTADLLQEKSTPFRYLSELENMKLPACITVKAYISTLTGKLTHSNGTGWALEVRINDGTAFCDVLLSDCVLTELIGFSAEDSVVMKEQMKSDPALWKIFTEGMSQCQQKLMDLCCLMDVCSTSKYSKPMVKKLTPITIDHVDQLKHRVKFGGQTYI